METYSPDGYKLLKEMLIAYNKTVIFNAIFDMTIIDEGTFLHHVDSIEWVKLLIEKGADVNVKNNNGRTPLHLALTIEKMKLLLNAGANINEKKPNGDTVLSGCIDIEQLQFLLENGADPNIRDNNGLLPIQKKWMNEQMKQILIQYGSKLE